MIKINFMQTKDQIIGEELSQQFAVMYDFVQASEAIVA